jgi:hypothetical protein
MTRNGHKAVFANGSFASVAGKTYYVCVDNGLASGAQRTAHFLLAADGSVVLTPADFKPNANPPQFVAAALSFDDQCHGHGDGDDSGDDGDGKHDGHGHEHHCGCSGQHLWSASLFGAETPATVSVSIRQSK